MDYQRYKHSEDVHNTKAACEIVPYLMERFSPRSVIDIGCGLGTWLSVFQSFGVSKVLGLDGNYTDRTLLKIDPNDFLAVDLEYPFTIQEKFDLAICLEVAEHLSEGSANTFVDSLIMLSDIICFSAAIPGQGGQNHVNEQWLHYWSTKFEKHGYGLVDEIRHLFWNNPNIEWWYRQNMCLFIKKDSPTVDNTNISFTFPKSYIHPELYLLMIRNR